MPSLLAQQLAKIAGPKVNFGSKAKASLIFDFKEAAEIDKTTLWVMSNSAFQALVQQQPSLRQFSDSLFSEASKDQNRMKMTNDESDRIDVLIQSFLQQISPMFLQTEALHLMEWLISRFQINEFNVDSIMECILPYHETKPFLKFVSILAISELSKWIFLKNAAEKKSPITRDLIVERCKSDRSLLHFVLKMMAHVTSGKIVHPTLSAFYVCILSQYVATKAIVDNDLRDILPHTLAALASKNTDSVATAFMILTMIAKKTELEQSVLSDILCIGASTGGASAMTILSLVTICQCQTAEIHMPEEFVHSLISASNFASDTIGISSEYHAERFLFPFLKQLYSMILSGKRAEGDIEVFSTLIGKMSISDQLMKELLAFCIMKPVDMRLDTIPTEVGVILRSLHQKYFPLMDPTIAALTKANTDPLVHGLIADIFRDTVSEPFADGSATLLLTLEHPQAVVRLLALERLEEILEADPTFEYSLLKDTFLNRINDNSAEIVSFVLDMPQLSQMVGTQLIPTLITLISRNGTGVIIKSKAISLLLGMGDLAAYERVFEEAVLGAILLTSTDNTELASFMKLLPVLLKFLNIDDMSTINLLIDQPQDDKNRKSLCSKINLEIIKMLSADVMKTPSRYLSALKSSQLLVRIAASLALNKAISDKPSANILAAQTYMEHMKSCLKTGTLDLGPDSASINGLPSLTFMNRLFKIGDNFETHLVQISAMCVAASLESARPAPCIWLDRKANGYTGAIIRMAEIFSEVRTIKFRDELLRQLIVRHGKNSTVELCCSIALSESSAARAIFLTLLSKLIGKLDFQLLVPVLLVSLHHSDIQTRKAAAVAITRLQASYNVEKDAAAPQIYGHGAFYGESSRNLQLLKSQSALELVSGIAARATEMTVDENYVMQCIESVVNPRKGLRENLLLFLVSNVIASTNLAFRNALLNVISRIESPVKLNCMSKLIAHELESKEISDLMYSGALLRCYNPKSIVGSRAVKHIKILSEVFKSTANESLQRVAIDLITPDFFAAMDPKGQRCILSQLLELFATGQQKFSDYAKLKLKDVMISDLLVRPLFDSMITKLTQDSTEKRRKTDQESSDTTILQLVQLLEIMLNNQIVNSISLIKDLFSVFNSILDLQMTEVFSAIEYSKQLLMNLIMKFTQLTDVGEINEEEYRVDLIIHCIRGTENSQTHHIALLLLAEIGSRAPNLVLLHMMPVFTFMGSQVINQDDNYSFSVIEETLKVIVPALIKGNGEQAEIMNVFVNALVHIPSHRRLKLFSTLGHTLSASKLGPLLALIVTASIRSKAKDIDLNAFGLSLLGQFEYGRQISAISGILALIQDEGEFFGSYDAKIHRKIDFQLAQFAKYCLSNGSVALDSCDSALHIELVEMILSLTTKYSAGSSKFEAAMSESLYGCLHDANANLTLGLFLSVVCSLLRHTNAIVQQKAILLLQERINVLGVDIREEDFSSALDVLVDLIQTLETQQMAILCIGIMVSAVGKQNVERYFGILSLIAGKDCLGLENHALVATSMTCIGSMVSVLGPRCLPMVPQILERILDILETPEIDLIVAECGLDTLATFFEVLPLFITFFIPRIVKLVTRSMPEALGSHRDELCALIGTNTQHSALSSHISRFVADINQSDELFIAPLLLIIKSLMKATAPQELMDSRNSYHNIFTALLPIQPEATILVIQEYIVNINETAFKPFFAGLVKWGRDNPVLLQIADMLLDTLKSLFIHHTTLIMDILLEDVNELKLSILTKVFAYDTVEYTSQDRFEKVSAVLLKCLNDGLPVEKALVALSTCRADLFKTIHKPILLSLRNDSDAVQICGIEIIKNLYEELPNMIQFFPEQVPFLAELLEDGSEQVQENTRELCDSIQSVLGEPIEQYFK